MRVCVCASADLQQTGNEGGGEERLEENQKSANVRRSLQTRAICLSTIAVTLATAGFLAGTPVVEPCDARWAQINITASFGSVHRPFEAHTCDREHTTLLSMRWPPPSAKHKAAKRVKFETFSSEVKRISPPTPQTHTHPRAAVATHHRGGRVRQVNRSSSCCAQGGNASSGIVMPSYLGECGEAVGAGSVTMVITWQCRH